MEGYNPVFPAAGLHFLQVRDLADDLDLKLAGGSSFAKLKDFNGWERQVLTGQLLMSDILSSSYHPC